MAVTTALVVGSLAGGALAADAARSASDDQVAAGDRAIASQDSALEQARGDMQPFREAGGAVLNPLTQFVLNGPETDLERTRGFQDIQRSAAAGGKLQSGGTLEELTGFNNMLNARNRQQSFNELFNLATLGSNAAAGQATATLNTASNTGNIQIGQGNASAAGRVGAANAVTDTFSDLVRLGGGL